MIKNRYLGLVLLTMSVAGCGSATSEPSTPADNDAAELSAAAEEAVAAVKEAEEAAAAAGLPPPGAATRPEIPTGGRPTNPQAESTVKAFINLQGQLCAEIVGVRPLAQPNTAEVTCIEYTGGTSRVTYVINLVSGDLQKAG